MKKKTIFVHSIFLIVIFLSISGFIGSLVYDYYQMTLHPDPDTDKFWGLGVFIYVMFFIPFLCFLVELYHCARYFLLSKKRTIFRTILNVFSITVYPVSTLVYKLRPQFEPSVVTEEILRIFLPLAVFLLMRMIFLFLHIIDDIGEC